MCAVSAAVPSCAPRACTNVGGYDGIAIVVPEALFTPRGEAVVEVCDDDGCGRATRELSPVPEGAVGRELVVSATDLGLELEPGEVSVEVELLDGRGRQVTAQRADVTVEQTFPNGEACDGDGYAVGTVVLEADRG